MDILDRNKKCPLCGKFYHRWDMHRNPIPTKKDQRTAESLCQCAKGEDAREFRRMKRAEMKIEADAKRLRRESILSMHERNKQYWQEIAGGEKTS